MKAAIAMGFAAVLLAGAAAAQGYNDTRPYARRDGSYVQPLQRTSPDGATRNHRPAAANVDPFTGQYGTRPPAPRSFDPYRPARRY